MKFHTKFDRPANKPMDFTDSPSLARPEFEPECNINNILAKFKVTGVLVDPSVRTLRQPMFMDCTSLPDLAQYHEQLNGCKVAFEQLPEQVKEAFGFDARTAMHWLSNATDAQVVHLFNQLVPSPLKGGLGGASTPQNGPVDVSAPPDSADKGAEPKSQEPPPAE